MPGLVIGYGNALRGDDGAGPFVAEQLRRLHPPGVAVIVQRQLVPELAADLAEATFVLFVDAYPATDGDTLRVRELQPAAQRPQLAAHCADPEALLGLTLAVYGRAPEAVVVMLPAFDFDRADLSAATRAAADAAIDGVLGALQTASATA